MLINWKEYQLKIFFHLIKFQMCTLESKTLFYTFQNKKSTMIYFVIFAEL